MNTSTNFVAGNKYHLRSQITSDTLTAIFKAYEPECDDNVTLAVFNACMDGEEICVDVTDSVLGWDIEAI